MAANIRVKLMSEELDQLLTMAGIRKKPMYRPGEVQAVLCINPSTFWRKVTNYEKDGDDKPIRPDMLRSYMHKKERRVTYQELEDFLKRNETYERLNAIPPNQLRFDFDS